MPALASHSTKSNRRFRNNIFHELHSFSVSLNNIVSKETGASSGVGALIGDHECECVQGSAPEIEKKGKADLLQCGFSSH